MAGSRERGKFRSEKKSSIFAKKNRGLCREFNAETESRGGAAKK